MKKAPSWIKRIGNGVCLIILVLVILVLIVFTGLRSDFEYQTEAICDQLGYDGFVVELGETQGIVPVWSGYCTRIERVPLDQLMFKAQESQ